MKKQSKKTSLQVRRETLRLLAQSELAPIVGGFQLVSVRCQSSAVVQCQVE